jgi:hypothetical protein
MKAEKQRSNLVQPTSVPCEQNHMQDFFSLSPIPVSVGYFILYTKRFKLTLLFFTIFYCG